MPREHTRYGVVHLSGWTAVDSAIWREGWHVFDRHNNGRVIAIYERAFTRGLRPLVRYRQWRNRPTPLPYPPDPEELSKLRRAAKLHARRLNVEERRWEDAVDLEELLG